jgi:hypothetical protein
MGRRLAIAGVGLAAVALVLTLVLWPGRAEVPEPFSVPEAGPAPSSASPNPADVELYGPRVELPGGMLLKQLGKVAELRREEPGEPWTIRTVIDRIEVNPPCDYGPLNRPHRLVLTLRVETSPIYNPGRDGAGPQYYEWSTIGPDGVSEAGPTTSQPCRAAAEQLPAELRPAAKYRGQVTVETANPAGQLVLDNSWVWNYPTG